MNSSTNTPTPHIAAKLGDIAKVVILTGDPLRAKKMAKKFLKRKRLVSNVRGNLCFCGQFEGTKVSIMSSGMGAPSMLIYAHELFEFFDVDYIIRVGTCGSLENDLAIGRIVVASKVFAECNLFDQTANKELVFETPKKMLSATKQASKDLNVNVEQKSIYSTNLFYTSPSRNKQIAKLGASAVEMESGALCFEAKKAKKKALCLLTVSDELQTGNSCTAKERENNFENMFKLALCVAKKFLEEQK